MRNIWLHLREGKKETELANYAHSLFVNYYYYYLQTYKYKYICDIYSTHLYSLSLLHTNYKITTHTHTLKKSNNSKYKWWTTTTKKEREEKLKIRKKKEYTHSRRDR